MPGIATLENIKEIQQRLKEFRKNISGSLDTELDELVKNVDTKAHQQVPYRTGRLSRSIRVAKSKVKVVRVGANAYNPRSGFNYAPIQHENLAFHHSVGKAKFIEDPLREEAEAFMQRFVDRVRTSD